MNPSQLMAYLHAIDIGELGSIESKLAEAKRACVDLKEGGLADALDEAERALHQADLRTYRKRVETVIARLGHIK